MFWVGLPPFDQESNTHARPWASTCRAGADTVCIVMGAHEKVKYCEMS